MSDWEGFLTYAAFAIPALILLFIWDSKKRNSYLDEIKERLLKAGYQNIRFDRKSHFNKYELTYRVSYQDVANKSYDEKFVISINYWGKATGLYWQAERTPPYADLFQPEQEQIEPENRERLDSAGLQDQLRKAVSELKQEQKL